MINRPRGTRDFLPEDMAKRREIERILLITASEFGYSEIATPVFEHAELFIKKSGAEIVNQMYIFKDKSDRELALRPELTASTIRLFLSEMERAPQPIKVSYFGNAFRYERPQKGRFREFWQFGAELIGADSPEAEAELVTLAVKSLMNAGLKNFVLRIGHLGILKGIFDEASLDENNQAELMRALDKGDKDEFYMALDSVDQLSSDQREILRKMIDTTVTVDYLDNFKPDYITNQDSIDAWNKLVEVVSLLIPFGVPKDSIQIDLNIARGLDYYTGLVFEIDVPELGAEKQVCGGGAYTLLELFGGKSAPTIGFAIGFDRLILALDEQKRPFESLKPFVFIIPVGKEAKSRAIEITKELRDSGIRTELEIKGRGPSKCLKYASNLGVSKAIIIGEDELAEDKVTIRDMESGDQEKIEIGKVAKYLSNL